jgi:hypothetical protein
LDGYDGQLDIAAVWGKVLTSDERDEFYNSGAGLEYADIVPAASGGPIWWYFERAKNFYDDLKGGLIPPDQLRQRYREVYI